MVAAKITSQSWFRSTSDAAQRPAELLGWTEITRDHLNRFQKYAPRGMVFRLPTEAEWEYACRAGTTTRFHFGETLNSDQANCAFKHSDYSASTTAQTRHRNRGETTVCGLYEPNAWGLHDMHGNVAEWCQDIYNKKWYEKSPQTDPLYTGDGPMRVYRGGGYDFAAGDWQSSARSKKEFSSSQGNLGFRLVLSFSPKER
jgi:formylglycine-generating enzyme required for sulfatase activity